MFDEEVFPGGRVVQGTGHPRTHEFANGASAARGRGSVDWDPALPQRPDRWELTVHLADDSVVECFADGPSVPVEDLGEAIAALPAWPAKGVSIQVGSIVAQLAPRGGGFALDVLCGGPRIPLLIEPETGQRFSCEPGRRVVIGRDEDCAICLHDPFVSRQHAAIDVHGDRCTLSDLGSKRGTAVNDLPIVGPTALAPGDRVRVGNTTLHVMS